MERNDSLSSVVTTNPLLVGALPTSTSTFSLPFGGNIANVNLYIAQAWNSDGTQVITPKVYPGDSGVEKTLTITSLSVGPAGDWYTQNAPQLPVGHTRIDVDGTQTGLSPGQPMTVLITDTSNGNTVYEYN